jgi:hypothetical protein
MRDDEPELPSGRLLMIMEAHERLKERKRNARRNPPPKEITCPATTSVAAHVSAPTSVGVTQASPSPGDYAPSIGKPRLEQAIMPKSRRPVGKDYAEVIRRIGRPAPPAEIAARAGVTLPSVIVWLNKWGADAGVQIVGTRRNLHGRPSNLYAIVEKP